MNPIRLIVATNGYIEDAQQSVMLWYNNYEECNLAGSLVSLASQLADLYRSEVLRDTHYEPGLPPFGERPSTANRYYPSGDRLLFYPFDPSEFVDRLGPGSPRLHINSLKTRAEILQWYLDLNTGGVVHTNEEIEKVRRMLKKELSYNASK